MESIARLFEKKKPVISFELFPPRTEKGVEKLEAQVAALAALNPDFISVTCHNHANIPKYTQHVCEVVQAHDIPALAHFTAVGVTKEELEAELKALKSAGVKNLLALRGDILDENITQNDMRSSVDLLNHIHHNYSDFYCAGTCYPNPHPESRGKDADIAYLKAKVDNGAGLLITQLFFDNEDFYEYVQLLRKSGITVPISAGIMPVTNKRQVERICEISGVEISKKYRRILDMYGDDEARLFEAGIAYATDQIIDLISQGIDGIHLYTLNNEEITRRIIENIRRVL